MIEIVIVSVICLAAVAAVGYFLYTKISSRDKSIDELIKRYRSIESIITRPHPSQEAYNLVNRSSASQRHETFTGRPTVQSMPPVQPPHQSPTPPESADNKCRDGVDDGNVDDNVYDNVDDNVYDNVSADEQELCETCSIDPIDYKKMANEC